jgi:hypothetical protein
MYELELLDRVGPQTVEHDDDYPANLATSLHVRSVKEQVESTGRKFPERTSWSRDGGVPAT